MTFKLSKKTILSPMAGVTDIAFRQICQKYSVGLTVTELISANAIVQNNKKTINMLRRGTNEKKFSIQIFGSDVEQMSKATKMIDGMCDYVDINMGCPAVKVCKIGAGSKLLDNPLKISEIVRGVVKNSTVPVTVKTRIARLDSDFEKNPKQIIETAKLCQSQGCELFTLHGRTSEQMFSGEANWDIIAKLKQSLDIPVCGNGDITTPEIAKKRIDESKVDYISIGRGSYGNPYIFKQIDDYLKNGKYNTISISEKLKILEDYLTMGAEEKIPIINLTHQAQLFTKGMVGGNVFRRNLSKVKSVKGIKEVLRDFVNLQDENN